MQIIELRKLNRPPRKVWHLGTAKPVVSRRDPEELRYRVSCLGIDQFRVRPCIHDVEFYKSYEIHGNQYVERWMFKHQHQLWQYRLRINDVIEDTVRSFVCLPNFSKLHRQLSGRQVALGNSAVIEGYPDVAYDYISQIDPDTEFTQPYWVNYAEEAFTFDDMDQVKSNLQIVGTPFDKGGRLTCPVGYPSDAISKAYHTGPIPTSVFNNFYQPDPGLATVDLPIETDSISMCHRTDMISAKLFSFDQVVTYKQYAKVRRLQNSENGFHPLSDEFTSLDDNAYLDTTINIKRTIDADNRAIYESNIREERISSALNGLAATCYDTLIIEYEETIFKHDTREFNVNHVIYPMLVMTLSKTQDDMIIATLEDGNLDPVTRKAVVVSLVIDCALAPFYSLNLTEVDSSFLGQTGYAEDFLIGKLSY